MQTGLIALQQGRRLMILVDSSSANSNAEPAHTQPSTLFPTCDEVINLTGLLETKGMSVSSGKQWKYASKVNSASKVNMW
jgi:hypothetical protein